MKPNAIDLSYCQQVPNYETLKKSGVQLVTIKATQGRALDGSGSPFKDPEFDNHVKAAVDAKMPLCFYHFFCACTSEQAKQEAKYFCDVIKPYKKYTLYAFLDCEVYGIQHMENLTRETLTELCLTFLQECQKKGYRAAMYTNPDHIKNRLNEDKLPKNKWVASYSTFKPNVDGMIMWQYGVGKVAGVTGDVDLDVHYMPAAELAVIDLVYKGFIASPEYWIQQLPKVKYLDTLIKKANETYSGVWSKSIPVDSAVTNLNADKVMNSPSYWKQKCKEVQYLDALLKILSGGVRK